jgi:sigma-B regulation protein RsbU (phosphoserine phosphatase)
MLKLGLRYIWFKLALAAGSLLGLSLLVQSIGFYYQVSSGMVIQELRREAQRQEAALVRDAGRLGIRDPVALGEVLKEIRQEAPNKIAWIKVIDMAGHPLVQDGTSVGPPVIPRFPRPESEESALAPDIRETPDGKVLVTALPLWLGRRSPGAVGQRAPGRAPVQPPGPEPLVRPSLRWVEIALYLDSASAVFGRLLGTVIVNCTAALGLVASMVLLWFRFPNYVNGKQLERQTELARQVQTDLLPSADSAFEGLDFAAECLPAWQVGGDFYDVFSTDDGHIAIVVGDVSGKGLPASVVVGLLLGAVRASSWLAGSAEHEASTGRLSELLRTRTSLERFASLFWCYYEPRTRVLRYVNAGHLPPMVVKRNGGELEIQRLEEGGPVLGVVAGAEYEQGQAMVNVGDLLVLYSDGVVEATNASDEQFGEERLLASIRETSARPSVEIRDEILRRVYSFLGRVQPQDDLTLVVARIRDAQNA